MHPDPERIWVYTQLEHRQTWRGWDDSGLTREQTGPPRFFTVDGQRRWEAAGSPELPTGLHQIVMAPGCMEGRRSRQRAARLPTDPVELRAAITREPRGERSPAEEDFSTITQLLRTPEASVELCVALHQVVCGLPDVVELGTVLDRAGRPGLGIETELGGYLHELVFDAVTERLLGEQETLSNPSSTTPRRHGHRLGHLSERGTCRRPASQCAKRPWAAVPARPEQHHARRRAWPQIRHRPPRPERLRSRSDREPGGLSASRTATRRTGCAQTWR